MTEPDIEPVLGDQSINLMADTAMADTTIQFCQQGKTVLIITPDGRFILGPGATVDDAARSVVEIATNLWRQRHSRS